MELILKDLETLDKRLQKVETDAKSGKKAIVGELEILKKIKTSLEQGNLARQFTEQNPDLFDEKFPAGSENMKTIKDIQLLTAKPGIFILNSNTPEISSALEKKIKDLNSEYIVASLRDEYDASKFTEEEKKELELGSSKLNDIVAKSYKILGLITFFTTGSDETRAWTVKKDTPAPRAAGVIHTDFEKNFICVEVINWEKLLKKELPQTKGKDYLIQDGDVIVVKHAP